MFEDVRPADAGLKGRVRRQAPSRQGVATERCTERKRCGTHSPSDPETLLPFDTMIRGYLDLAPSAHDVPKSGTSRAKMWVKCFRCPKNRDIKIT